MSMTDAKRKNGGDAGPPSKKFKSDHGGNKSKSMQNGKEPILNGQSSREAHIKQKELKRERMAAKPNADSIARSKKIWERLRIKSAIPIDERKKLVEELFEIITGRVAEFVFKHDSVRVIQCAVKYANPQQKLQIAQELRGSYKDLAESKYAKFLVAKLITEDKSEGNTVRDMVVPEFYGHVKRLVRHPEAGWILDDIYRTIASEGQKARLLREWYGGEFAVPSLQQGSKVTADLSEILKESPGKKGPVMSHLKEMTNQLVQKKTTGFTMLHDALLQYFLNCTPGTSEHNEFLEMLRDDEEGDLFKNLAFTKSGSKVVCLALAYGSSKDRRTILKHYKTHVKLMAYDVYAHAVLLTAFEVIDDTVMTAKAIISELTCKDLASEHKDQELLGMATNLVGRIPLLFLMADESPKWLLDTFDQDIISQIRQIRKEHSKKDPATRRSELNKAIAQPLLDFITSQAATLVTSSFGCQFMGEVLIGAEGEKEAALDAVSALAADEEIAGALKEASAARLFKSLVQGGRFDPATKTVKPTDPPLEFADKLYNTLKDAEGALLSWATGSNAWSIVAMLENETFQNEDELKSFLAKHKPDLSSPKEDKSAAAGTRILLEKIDASSVSEEKPKKQKSKSEKKPKKTKA